jgi:hypothetical protein
MGLLSSPPVLLVARLGLGLIEQASFDGARLSR